MTGRRARLKRSTRFKVLWTVWMGVGGVVVTAIVYAMTGSVGWALVALVVSGPVLNTIGQAITQPMGAVLRNRRGHV
jgi:hypothetical protein